jgi:hypothetical protein
VPGAVYRRFAPPEPTMGIGLAWRRGAETPALRRLREIALQLRHFTVQPTGGVSAISGARPSSAASSASRR